MTKVKVFKRFANNVGEMQAFWDAHDVVKWSVSHGNMIIEYNTKHTNSITQTNTVQTKNTDHTRKNTDHTRKKKSIAEVIGNALYNIGRDMARLNRDLNKQAGANKRLFSTSAPKMFNSETNSKPSPKRKRRKKSSKGPRMFCSDGGGRSKTPKMFNSNRPSLF